MDRRHGVIEAWLRRFAQGRVARSVMSGDARILERRDGKLKR